MQIQRLAYFVVNRKTITYNEVSLRELWELSESGDAENLEVVHTVGDAEGLCELLRDISSGREKYDYECHVGCGCEPIGKVLSDSAAARQRVVDFGNSIRGSTDKDGVLKEGSKVFAIFPVTVHKMRDGAKRVSVMTNWGETIRVYKEDLFFSLGDKKNEQQAPDAYGQ